MRRILILSVGGSAEPLVNAIKKARPDFVYFFCSGGPKGSTGMVDGSANLLVNIRKTKCPKCGHDYSITPPRTQPIVIQTGLTKDQYEIVAVDDPDDLNACYLALRRLGEIIAAKDDEFVEITANYTGGSKTMSLALALVGLLTEQWNLALNVGPRVDLIKVRSGDVPIALDKWCIFADLQIGFVRKSIANFDYGHAVRQLDQILAHPIETILRNNLLRAQRVCSAFDLWDKFSHGMALNLLPDPGTLLAPHVIALKKITGKAKATGYEIVGDLLNNAARKAHRGLYDDAVARLYRATELFAQIRLRTVHKLESGNMALSDLPESLRNEYLPYLRDNNRVVLGLREDYILLWKLLDEIGQMFKAQESRIMNVLTKRNQSIAAHGLTPLDEDDYKDVHKVLSGFIQTTAASLHININVLQFPQEGIL